MEMQCSVYLLRAENLAGCILRVYMDGGRMYEWRLGLSTTLAWCCSSLAMSIRWFLMTCLNILTELSHIEIIDTVAWLRYL